jgi:hypothetical protein
MEQNDASVLVDNQRAAKGLRLRSLLVLLLLEAGRPLTVPDLVRSAHRWGFSVEGRAGKTISDALRWEIRRGRVRKLGRGVYAVGTVDKVTKHRMRRRLSETRDPAQIRLDRYLASLRR